MFEDLSEFWNYQIVTLPSGDQLAVGQLLMVLLLLVGGWFVGRVIAYLLKKKLSGKVLRPDAAQVLSRMVFWLIVIIVAITAMGLLNIPLTAFAFISGAVAIGVGFGAQNIINNFISGWILMTERPIRIDDFVEVNGMHGTVEEIGNRSTRIRRTDGVHLLVPNSALLESTVVNWTLVDQAIRSIVRVGVAYGSPVEQVRDLMSQALAEQPEVKLDPAPSIIFEDFGDNALIFDAYFWRDALSERDMRQVRSNIRFRISRLFAENGIVIAFPQRDVHIDVPQSIPIHMVDQREPE